MAEDDPRQVDLLAREEQIKENGDLDVHDVALLLSRDHHLDDELMSKLPKEGEIVSGESFGGNSSLVEAEQYLLLVEGVLVLRGQGSQPVTRDLELSENGRLREWELVSIDDDLSHQTIVREEGARVEGMDLVWINESRCRA